MLLSTITVSGDVTEEIIEDKYSYRENGLLSTSENDKFLYSHEYDEFNNLKKMIHLNKKKNRTEYMTYEYKEKQKIKQGKYSFENILKYEFTFEYDNNGRRVAVLKDNKFLGYRDYDNNGLLQKYQTKEGFIVYFIWENKYSNFDWNMIYAF